VLVTMSVSLVGMLASAYQLGPAFLPAPHARASSLSMEYRLNNYILPGPMQPLGNQVLVKLRRAEDKTGGGLFLATGEAEKPKEGVVVAAGPGLPHPDTGKLLENPLKEGDLVLLSDFSGEKVDYNDQKHLFIDANNVLGCFTDSSMTVATFKPLGDRVMVEMPEAVKETTTGIALAGMEDEDGNQGVVTAVGPGKLDSSGSLVTPTISVGESVLYKGYTGADATVDGRQFKIVFEGDCLAKW